jgi:hypothetical protein
VSAKQLFGHILAVYLLAVVCFLLLAANDAVGMPVEPDIKQLVEEAQQPPPLFIPSRVGWNGSEMLVETGGLEATTSPILAAERERRFRSTLWSIAVPEPRAILGITAIIFLLRKLRSLRGQQAMPAQQPQAA